MGSDFNSAPHYRERRRGVSANGASGSIYGLGFLGSLIYFILHAASFTDGLIGFLQSLVWPGVLVYRVFEFLKL